MQAIGTIILEYGSLLRWLPRVSRVFCIINYAVKWIFCVCDFQATTALRRRVEVEGDPRLKLPWLYCLVCSTLLFSTFLDQSLVCLQTQCFLVSSQCLLAAASSCAPHGMCLFYAHLHCCLGVGNGELFFTPYVCLHLPLMMHVRTRPQLWVSALLGLL